MNIGMVINYIFIVIVLCSVNFVTAVLKGILKPEKGTATYNILTWIGGLGSVLWLSSIILLPFIAHYVLYEWEGLKCFLI